LNLAWDAPTTNVDGTPLTDLAEYRIYAGTSSPPPCPGSAFLTLSSTTPTPSPGDVIAYQLTGLTENITYFVQVTAVDTGGNESDCSNEASGTANPGSGGGSGSSGSVGNVASSGEGGGGGGCFIATAAYGSPMAREVQILREFRNRYLLSHTPGRQLVGVYNSLSPPLARAIAQSDALRSLVRTALHPVLWWVYLFLWSPVLAGGVLLGMPITTSCLILRVTRRYRPVTTPR